MQELTLPGYISKHLIALYFLLLICVFCTQLICLVFDGLLQSNCFRMFCSKHSITFENMYRLSCSFHRVDKLCVKLRLYETLTVTNFMTRILFIETRSSFTTIKYCFILYLHIYHVSFRFL